MDKRKEHKKSLSGSRNLKTELLTRPEKWKYYIVLIVIIMISFFSYLPVFQNTLLLWDDNDYIRNNPLIYNFNLKEIFSTNVMGNYHPLTILILAVAYHFFGLNAAGYHAINLLLHLLNVILVFYVIFLLSDRITVALIASFLFGIHPLHVESVAWAAELKDLLYTCFFLASYIFYLKYLKELRTSPHQHIGTSAHRHIGTSAHRHISTSAHRHISTSAHRHISTSTHYYLLALLLFILSLLSKAMAASLVLVLILTDYFFGRKLSTKTLIEKIPFFLPAIFFGIVAVVVQKSSGATELTTLFTLPDRLVFACYGFVTYLFKLLLPIRLSAYYPYPITQSGIDIPTVYYVYVFFFMALVAFTIHSHRFSKKIIFGLGFFAITVFLVLKLLPVGKTIMADRYSYIPSIGIFYLAGEGLLLLWQKKQKIPVVILLSLAAIFFSVKTYSRCKVWENDNTLWTDVINKDKTSWFAYYNRGVAFVNEKRNDAAISDFNKVIELNPGYSETYNTRGSAYFSEDKLVEAARDFNRAIELKPDNAYAFYNRGTLFVKVKRNIEAISDYTRAIELNPGYQNAYYNRGIVFLSLKRYDEAVRDLSKTIELKPDFANAYNNRGLIFFKQKRNGEAIQDFNKAIELQSNYIAAYNNKANLLFEESRYEEAIDTYTTVINLQNDHAQAYYKRGLAAYHSDKKVAACLDLKRAAGLGYRPAADTLSYLCK